MSDDDKNETALVLAKGRDFKMPDFSGRKDHLKGKWDELIKTTKLDVKTHVDKETNRAIDKVKEAVISGTQKVTDDQKDFEQINK